MEPFGFGKNNFDYKRGYEDGYKWSQYDYARKPGPEYDAGFMAGYFERNGRPFDGQTYSQMEQQRKQTNYQNNSYYAKQIFGASNPVTVQTTGLLKAIVVLIVFFVISSAFSLFDNDKTAKKPQEDTYNKQQASYEENLAKATGTNNQIENNFPKQKEVQQSQVKNNAEQIDWASYMKRVERKIELNWIPKKESQDRITTIVFKINKNGELVSYKVLKSSGSKIADEIAIDALKISAPFAPLPKEFSGNEIEVEFTFDYHKKAK